MRTRIALLLVPLVSLGCQPKKPANPPDDSTSGATQSVEAEGEQPEAGDPPAAAEVEPLTCERPEQFGPVIVTADQYAHRYAATATRFSEVSSTREQPAEVCGIGAGVELLMTLKCDDGSSPFADFMTAHSSRVGNVGSAGRCGSIVDLYQAPCPEKTYEVYIDSYICADLAAFN